MSSIQRIPKFSLSLFACTSDCNDPFVCFWCKASELELAIPFSRFIVNSHLSAGRSYCLHWLSSVIVRGVKTSSRAHYLCNYRDPQTSFKQIIPLQLGFPTNCSSTAGFWLACTTEEERLTLDLLSDLELYMRIQANQIQQQWYVQIVVSVGF